MTYPVFASGDVLNASDMNAVGRWLVKTQTIGTAVSSVEVTSAFSSDYVNYEICVDATTTSAGTELLFLLGSATTSYYSTYAYYSSQSAGDAIVRVNNGSSFSVGLTDTSTGRNFYQLFVSNPQTTVVTSFTGLWSARLYNGFSGGVQNSATQFTSFKIQPGTGTMTGGTIRVYGYRD